MQAVMSKSDNGKCVFSANKLVIEKVFSHGAYHGGFGARFYFLSETLILFAGFNRKHASSLYLR